MSRVFVIGELACTWLHGGLEAAYRGIRAVKECDADAAKFQWTSDPTAMHKRRGISGDHYKRLAWPKDWLPLLKAECDRVGIEFMCTVFIPGDIEKIAPYVSRFKISAFESENLEFLHAHVPFNKRMIVSQNPGWKVPDGYFRKFWTDLCEGPGQYDRLHCISKYPTNLEDLGLSMCRVTDEGDWMGLSCHCPDVRVGGWAVAAGARILEAHVRLEDAPTDDPDYGHSFLIGPVWSTTYNSHFAEFVRNARDCEVAL